MPPVRRTREVPVAWPYSPAAPASDDVTVATNPSSRSQGAPSPIGEAPSPADASVRNRDADDAKLVRLTVMAHEVLDEIRQTSMDEPGRRRLQAIDRATVAELKTLLPPKLARELEMMTQPFEGAASEPEVRLAHVLLVGWLEGLMNGIQAALWARVVHALSLAHRHVPPETPEEGGPGQYL